MRTILMMLAYLASLLLLFPRTSTAQNPILTQVLKGSVLDKAVKTPLVGVTIQLLVPNPDPAAANRSLGAYSDAEGRFRIDRVPVGKVALRISYLGYKEAILGNVTVNSGKEVDLIIELEEDLIKAKEVVVTAKIEKQKPLNEMAMVSARTFSVEETQRFAAAVNDPARMAASFAGVVAGNDGNNTIVVRGNAPNGLLWRMEGVDIPAPNHFSAVGSSGGGISILSSQLLSNSDFMTGAFAAEYGNALSGVFDLRLRRGNQDKREYTFQAGVLGLDAAVEGPFGRNKGSFLVNYRYSTLSLLSKAGVEIGDATTNFQDLSFNAWMPAGKFGAFSLFGMGGLSRQSQAGEADSLLWKEDLQQKYTTNYVANTGVLGLVHTKAWDRTFLKTVIAASVTDHGYDQEEYQQDYSKLTQYDQGHKQLRYTLSSTLNHKINARHLLRTGAYVTLLGFDFGQKDWNWEDKVLEQKVKTTGTTATVNAFAQWQYRASEKLTLQAGLHNLYFHLNQKNSLEPRTAVKYAVTKRGAFSVGYGLHGQVQPLGTYFAQNADGDTPNRDLGMSKAHHFVLAYDQSLRGNWRAKAELYYQDIFQVPVTKGAATTYSMLNHVDGFETQTLENKGIGKNYGLELTLEKFLTKGFYLLLSSSLYSSQYQGSDGIWRDTRFNCNHASTLTAGKEWDWSRRHKNRSVGLNLKLSNNGGIRYSPLDLAASREQGTTVFDESRAYQEQASEYLRLDLGFRLKRNYTRLTTTFGLDIQNATNRKNEFIRYYDPAKQAEIIAYQAPLIPILYYRVEF
jgi:hypothetical protein